METKYIVNFSGGKDSTAMLLWLLDRKYPIDYIVFCDTGVEYPEVYRHIRKVDTFLRQFDKHLIVLKGKHDFVG